MNRILVVLILIILSVQSVYAQNQVSKETSPADMPEYALEDLYALALERAEQIKISEEDLFIAERGRDKALADLLPTVSAFGEYIRYSAQKLSPSGFTIQPDSTTSWGLRMDQSFFISGREFTAFKIAKENITRSWLDLSSVKEAYLLTVSSAYYNVLKAIKALDIATANVKRLTKHRDAAKARLEVGEATKTVLLRAEAELASAEADLIKTRNLRKLASTVLARTVGIDNDYTLQEHESREDDFAREKLENLAFLQEIALSERSDLRAAELQKKIAEDEVRHTKGLYWPILSLEGVYVRSENDPSSSFEIDERVYGGLRLDFPFFEGGLRRAEVRESRARLRQSGLNYEDVRKTVNIEVERAYLDFMTQKGILKSLEDQLIFAKDNYNAVSKQFQYGLADSIDVMDANTLLVTAERELANAEFNYQLAILEVKRATGTLLKSVINQSVEPVKENN